MRKEIKKKEGAIEMDILAAASLVASVMITTALIALEFERQMDVLHGPYIEGRDVRSSGQPSARFVLMARVAMERLQWKARNIAYVTSLVAC